MFIKYKGQLYKRIDNAYDKHLKEAVMSELNKLYNETHRLEQKLGIQGLFHQFKHLSKDYDEILKAWNIFITKAENSFNKLNEGDNNGNRNYKLNE